jgi:hypothetical protein
MKRSSQNWRRCQLKGWVGVCLSGRAFPRCDKANETNETSAEQEDRKCKKISETKKVVVKSCSLDEIVSSEFLFSFDKHRKFFPSADFLSRVARFFLVQTYQNGKYIPIDHNLYQVTINYSKWP